MTDSKKSVDQRKLCPDRLLQNLGDSVAPHEQAVAHSPGNGQSGQSSHDIVYVKMSNAYATRTLAREDTFFIGL